MNKLRKIIPWLLYKITGKPRLLLKPEWAPNAWVHNAFQALHQVIWHPGELNEKGEVIQERRPAAMHWESSDGRAFWQFFTAQAFLAQVEGWIRGYFENLELVKIEVTQLKLAIPGTISMPWLSFAIAFGAASTYGSGTTSVSFSFSTAGSNRMVFAGTITDAATNTNTGSTYNSVAMHATCNVDCPFGGWGNLWDLAGAATGSNTLATSFSGGGQCEMVGVYYTGAGALDNQTTNSTSVGITGFDTTLTPNADNCWLVLFAQANTGTVSAGTNTTSRANSSAIFFSSMIADNNAAVHPAASTTLQATNGSVAAWGTMLASFSPAATTSIFSVGGVPQASISKVSGEANANIKYVSGVPNA